MMNDIDYLYECRKFYTQRLLSRYGQPLGADESEVLSLQEKLGFDLPLAYRQFLLWMGNDKQGVLKGSEWFIDEVCDNQDFLEEFLTDNGVSKNVSGQVVCFFSHQGYMAAWFSIDGEQADPFCELYSEANSSLIPVGIDSFSSFLLKELQGVAEVLDGK